MNKKLEPWRTGLELAPSELAPVIEGGEASTFARAKAYWFFGEWQQLTSLELQELEVQPDRDRFTLLVASAHHQLGHHEKAREYLSKALEWGCSRELVARVLIAGVHNTLGRAAALKGDSDRIASHFKAAVATVSTNDTALVSHARSVREMARLGLLSEAASLVDQELEKMHTGSTLRPSHEQLSYRVLKREVTLLRSETAFAQQGRPKDKLAESSDLFMSHSSDWLVEIADQCLAGEDPHAMIDAHLNSETFTLGDKFQLCLLFAEQFNEIDDNLSALHFIGRAADYLSQDSATASRQRMLLSRRLAERGRMDEALDLAVGSVVTELGLTDKDRQELLSRYHKTRAAMKQHLEHGHELLIEYLRARLPELRAHECGERRPVLIEIGSTREDVPGQGSTRKLAEFCKAESIDFITVDMDPHNTKMAEKTFEKVEAPFKAVTDKGEDFLRSYKGNMDFVFLDAYDFDHGKHSEIRQSRYRQFLGGNIDEKACHAMHLDCAKSIASKLPAFGVVCIDDTWLDDGNWCAKGTLAVPYLLENNFKLVESRNRAVLLERIANTYNESS